MQRRTFIAGSAMLLPLFPALAHHGWSSFDQTRPIWLEGRAAKVNWRNPHAELELDLPAQPSLPADLPSRTLPAQSAPVDGPALLRTAVLPTRPDRRWLVELAPLSRLQAWKAEEIKPGDPVAIVGFTFAGEKGDAIVRAEYLFHAGKVYGLRSSPA